MRLVNEGWQGRAWPRPLPPSWSLVRTLTRPATIPSHHSHACIISPPGKIRPNTVLKIITSAISDIGRLYSVWHSVYLNHGSLAPELVRYLISRAREGGDEDIINNSNIVHFGRVYFRNHKYKKTVIQQLNGNNYEPGFRYSKRSLESLLEQ